MRKVKPKTKAVATGRTARSKPAEDPWILTVTRNGSTAMVLDVISGRILQAGAGDLPADSLMEALVTWQKNAAKLCIQLRALCAPNDDK